VATGRRITRADLDSCRRDVNRVHLFAVAPSTFYKTLVNNASIQGFWGGAFGDASSCPSCTLNPLSNSAYLVGD